MDKLTVDDLQRTLKIKDMELNRCLIRESRIMQILTKIIMALPPKPITKDGVTYEYNDPNAMKTLNYLRDKINDIVEDVKSAVDDSNKHPEHCDTNFSSPGAEELANKIMGKKMENAAREIFGNPSQNTEVCEHNVPWGENCGACHETPSSKT